jgi:uncharacterized surface anchored protein
VTCLYINKGSGALKITKTNGKGGTLDGATFSITGPNSYSNTVTTANGGVACVDGLAAGNYTVTETSAPSGFAIDTTGA